MNFRTTAIMIGLLAVLTIVLLFVRSRSGGDSEREPRVKEEPKLVALESSDVNKVVVTSADDGKLVLHKTGNDWQVVEPQKMPAESSEVSDLTFALTGLNATEFVKESDVPAPLRPNSASALTVA